MNANLYALFADHFADNSDQPCLLVPDGPVIRYEELVAESGRMANALRTAGCQPGDRVAVQTDKHWQVLALYLACLRAGFIYLPLNTGYVRNELSFFFSDSEPRVIVCRPEDKDVISAIANGASVLTLGAARGSLTDRSRNESDSFATVVSAPDDPAAILYTSGTTGRSKGAILTHRNLGSNAVTLVEEWGFTRGDLLLHALPIYHVHGLFVATNCALLSGSHMLWLPKFDAAAVVALLSRTTVMMGIPTFYTRLLQETSFRREACRNVRLFISGSAPLPSATFDAFRSRTGQAILERYGMTETGMLTSNPLSGPRLPGTVGPPLPGVSLRIVDDTGAPCPPGAVGCIEVKGPNVFAGYWRMPERTREDFSADGYFKTGDLASWTAEHYVRIVGRAKDLIISGGLNVYPKEVEDRVNAIDGVAESAVIGVPDSDLGEAVVAVVVPRPNHSLTESRVIALLKSDVANFKVPKRVFFLDHLPRNAMGKVQKNVLRANFGEAFTKARAQPPVA